MTKSKDNIIVPLIVSVVVFGAVFAFWGVKNVMVGKYLSHFKPPPVTISTSIAKNEIWHPMILGIGSLVAIHGVSINPQVAGVVTKINFSSGQQVVKNQLLLEQDTSVEQADLKNFDANLNLAEIDYHRQQSLFQKKNIAKSVLDTAYAKLEQAQAEVAKTKAEINYKNIRAPFSGKLGIRKVNLGEFLQPGSEIVTLQALGKLYVDFQLPEQDYTRLYTGEAVNVTSDAAGSLLFHGKIEAISSAVSNDTRTLMVRAIIDNAQHKLLPGMFANVQVVLAQQNHVVTVPRTAITYSLYGDSVYVVSKKAGDKNNKPHLVVTREYIKAGAERGNEVQILEGVRAGEQVVTVGQLKLSNHATVTVKN